MSAHQKLTSSIFEKQSHYDCSAEELYNWHARVGALERLLPPWENTTVLHHTGAIEPGAEADLKMQLGPFYFTFKAQHIEAVPGKMFRDIQTKGPFAKWSHSHFFQEKNDRTVLLDRIDYQLPFHSMLPQYMLRLVSKKLDRMFSYRNEVLRQDLLLHKSCSCRPLRILVSGASGSLGRELLPLLTTGGHQVWSLVRRTPVIGKNEIFWDPEKGILDPRDLPVIDGVVHLAGEYIGLKRWTKESKRRVLESRIKSTSLLSKTIAQLDTPPEVFLCASAVGFYGDCGDGFVDENHPCGSDFISEVCSKWEQAAHPAVKAKIRTVYLRLGVGLTPRSGALKRILSTSPLGFHCRFGNGNQYISWVSNDDMISAMLHALVTPTLAGAVNIAAPTPVTNRQLMGVLAKITGRPRLFPIPAWPLQLAYGQMASEILLSGCRVSCQKLLNSGFAFRHPDIETALRFMLGKGS